MIDADADDPRAATSGYTSPPELLTETPMWVLWNGVDKVPIAPWYTGNCYPAPWGAQLDADDRPETTYDRARMYAQLPPSELHHIHPFPSDDDIPDQVISTILLPPNGHGTPVSSNVMYVDLDDVRDPDTGRLTPEAAAIVDRLDSYTEVSRSETGLHISVVGRLPEGVAAVNGDDLDDQGSIELYDHGRFFAGTWHHVAGTPIDVHERQDAIDELIERYSAHRLPDKQDQGDEIKAAADGSGSRSMSLRSGTRSFGSVGGDSSRSPYYNVDTADFAAPDPTEREQNGRKQGAHPHHGKTTGGDTSLNYNLERDGRWHCFAHGSGGGALEMAAVMADELDCRDAGAGCLNRLGDNEFLRACVYARDQLDGFTEDMKPPYRALVATARHFGINVADEDDDRLGRVAYAAAAQLYAELTVTDLD